MPVSTGFQERVVQFSGVPKDEQDTRKRAEKLVQGRNGKSHGDIRVLSEK